MTLYFSCYIHKIGKFIRIQPILKSSSKSFPLIFFLAWILKKSWLGQSGLGSGLPNFSGY